MEWLTEIRHRGAFSAVMPYFENLCRECFRRREKGLEVLPPKWIKVLLPREETDVDLFGVDCEYFEIDYSTIGRTADVDHRGPGRGGREQDVRFTC
jgi:THADA/TRM732, DUF2428